MSTDQSRLGEFDQLEERNVYVTQTVSKGAQVYHTDSSCQYVTEEHKPILITNAKDRHLDKCQYCAGEVEYKNPHGEESERCGAPTTKGHPCRSKSLAGFDRCTVHLAVDDTGGGLGE